MTKVKQNFAVKKDSGVKILWLRGPAGFSKDGSKEVCYSIAKSLLAWLRKEGAMTR